MNRQRMEDEKNAAAAAVGTKKLLAVAIPTT